MYFCDEAKIKVIAGKGGDGMISFRREKFIPKGGPHGGNGGKGGDVIFKVNLNLNTLHAFKTHKFFRAENGGGGGSWQKHGLNGQDLVLEVPSGTLIYDTSTHKLIVDLNTHNQAVTIAQGGRGGYGNEHFKSSVRQCPRFAELGDRGEEKELQLELKLVADVGIIGYPSVGKSTLISVISNAKPKIADYPFTTLIPNLGTVYHKGKDFVACDVPGLNEGAAEGKGLGHQFLRHVERCRLLIHLLDASHGEKILEEYQIIRVELKEHSPRLARKREILVLNKTDLISPVKLKQLEELFFHQLSTVNCQLSTTISCATRAGLTELLDEIIKQLSKLKKPKKLPANKLISYRTFRPHLEDPRAWEAVRKNRHLFLVKGQRVEQIARMTMWGNPEAEYRVYDVLHKLGAYRELVRLGAKVGDKIRIGEKELGFRELD